MAGRKWTPEELATLRAEYRRGRSEELATRLGRTWPAVAQKAELLGLGRKYGHRPEWTPELEAEYRRLHSEGRTDAEIARAWGKESVLRVWLNAHRRRLGLPSNRSKNPHFRARCRETLQKQLERAGKKNFAEFRHDRCRELARAYGLPEGLQPRAVQLVLFLLTGPKTKSQMCAHLGMTYNPAHPQKCLNAGRGGASYLTVLRKHGLIFSRRITGTGGKGPAARGVEQTSYALTPLALAILAGKGGAA